MMRLQILTYLYSISDMAKLNGIWQLFPRSVTVRSTHRSEDPRERSASKLEVQLTLTLLDA